mgnify:CR=1 FL=1|jgi:hypothetical protein
MMNRYFRDTPIKSEKEFLSRVLFEAELAGWEKTYHTFNSKRSTPGFPDLCMVRDNRLVFAELKMTKAKPTKPQQEWLEALGAVPGVEAYLWRPSDIDEILECLGAKTE